MRIFGIEIGNGELTVRENTIADASAMEVINKRWGRHTWTTDHYDLDMSASCANKIFKRLRSNGKILKASTKHDGQWRPVSFV